MHLDVSLLYLPFVWIADGCFTRGQVKLGGIVLVVLASFWADQLPRRPFNLERD